MDLDKKIQIPIQIWTLIRYGGKAIVFDSISTYLYPSLIKNY